MAADEIAVIGGIDTHTDTHQAAVIDTVGRHLATEPFPTSPVGYQQLLDWLRSRGEALAVGVEGTGAYRAELARFLSANGITVVEVDRPDRKARQDNGKSDPVDAYAAATAVLSGRAKGTPKSRNGIAEDPRTAGSPQLSHQGPHPDHQPDPYPDRPHPFRSARAVPGIAHRGADRPPGPLPPRRRSGGPGLRRQDSSAASRSPLPGAQPGDRRYGR
ncbi:transposase [Streptomyces sp. NPDC019539]|uniref:IS110 family transposase n=1 Tax=Streptomyces sp. NPDC019539 TaxID=3365063 RepID=UPI00379A8257